MFKGLIFFVKEGWKYDKRYILWNVFYQLINAPIPVVTALIPKWIIDELMGQQRSWYLLGCIAALTGYLLLSTILSVYFMRDGFSRRCEVAAEFDHELHRRLYECDYANLEDPGFLEKQERAKKFLYCNWHGFGYLLDCALSICGHTITLLGIAAILASMNYWILLLFMLLSVLGALVESRGKRRIKQLDDAVVADQRGWTYYAGLFEKAEFGKEFRLYQMGAWLLDKERSFFTCTNQNIRQQNREFIRSGTVSALFSFVQQAAAYGYLAAAVLYGRITVGAFTMYLGAVTAFSVSFRQVMNAFVDIRAHDLYYDDLQSYLSVPSTLRGGKRPVPSGKEHTIQFCDVAFRYQGSGQYALKNINITLQSGEKMLVVGENGAGKSTFVKLLLRLYDPTEGKILLDGVDIRSYDYDSYTALFSTVFQDYRLFAFSLRDNVTMSKEADDAKITQILRQTGLGGRLDQLAGGLDTAIHKTFDETGFEPSGGEGQKIAIARALYRDAPIIILDEPTAALDPRAEFEIYQQFQDMIRGKTAVYISHRLSSAKFCDKVVVFEDGCITEYGSPAELLQNGGRYAELYNMQADFYRR